MSETTLAAYAATSAASKGRRIPEAAPPYRGEFQRDRDRIIHAKAFRRLEYKTQVFINHEGDLFRTRLTHTLEVAQVARTMARVLGLNEDLTEAIALAHDLGHTPFGHAGQDALNECMRDFGGFEHNLQSLRVVDELEDRYVEFPGLNLTFETREGILKHCARKNARELGELGQRFLDRTQPTLEAQLTNLADEIAYNSHDVDDGLRAGLLSMEDLAQTRFIADLLDQIEQRYGAGLSQKKLTYQLVRFMIDSQVRDLVETSRRRLADSGVDSVDAVRARTDTLISFSDDMLATHRELKQFLFQKLYRHHRVYRLLVKMKGVISDLFRALMDDPRLLPPAHFERASQLEQAAGDHGRARAVADYVAGMTDRFAIAEHERLFDPRVLD